MRTQIVAVALVGLLAAAAAADPYAVGTTPKGPWVSWGYDVDYQGWANWLVVQVPWGTEEEMSGNYLVEEDFLFRVDPDSSGLADPHTVYDQDFWNHDDVYGLGEFFDAGTGTHDKYYALELSLGETDTWKVFYESPRDLNYVYDFTSGEHYIFEGTVTSYWNRGGYFYGILAETDSAYNGVFTATVTDGTPDILGGSFHAGFGDPIPEPATMGLLAVGLAALAARMRRAR